MRQAVYDKFLNAKPKIFGVNILDVYITFGFWFILSVLQISELVRLPVVVVFSGMLFFYKKKFKKSFLYFFLKKRKYTLVQIQKGANE